MRRDPRRALRTLEGISVAGKRVLVRVCGDVALGPDGRPVTEGEQRLRAVLPTLRDLQERGASIVLLSHLGRPRGAVVESLRLRGVLRRLSELLETPIPVTGEVRGPEVAAAVRRLEPRQILSLENLRFDPGEEGNDAAFARFLAGLGDLYVNEAFADTHRAHASLVTLPRLLPSYAGPQLVREVRVLSDVLERPARPAVAIVSGVKIETKLKLLANLLPRVDRVLTGGVIANTLLRASGYAVGASRSDRETEGDLGALLATYREKIILPSDARVAREGETSRPLIVALASVTATDLVYDLGPETVAAYCRVLSTAKTCVWNGPLGKFELPAFAASTRAVAECVRGEGTFSVVGGGDTVRAMAEMNCLGHFDHVSTGGGAMLAFLEGSPMPGLEPLWVS